MVSAKEPVAQVDGLALENMPIVLPGDATEVEKSAAKELQAYLRKMTGKAASITTEGVPMESAIYIGKTAFENAQDATFYFWSADDYAAIEAAGGALTKENATYTTEPTSFEKYSDGTWEFITYSEGIYAMDYSDTLYAAMCVTDANGVEHCSGVVNYSPEYYASRQLSKTNIAANLKNVIQWMVVYGERAADYFG